MSDLNKLLSIVPTNGITPHLESFHFYKDRVQATNSRVWYDIESQFSISCSVKAAEFVKALSIMNKEKLEVYEKSEASIKIKDDSYDITIPLIIEGEFPKKEPVDFNSDFMLADDLKSFISDLKPLMGSDNSKPFINALHFVDGFAYAADHALLARFDVKKCFSRPFDFMLPNYAIDPILNHDAAILSIQAAKDDGIYIFFDDGAWIFYRNLEAKPPDFAAMIASTSFDNLPAFPEKFTKAVRDINALSMMSDLNRNYVMFSEIGVHTREGDYYGHARVGKWDKTACLNGTLLNAICEHATRIDINRYPGGMPFCNEDRSFCGIIMGINF